MSIVTQEMLDAGRTRFQYVSFDKDDGLIHNTKDPSGKIISSPIPGIQGYFLGIGEHDFEYKDKQFKKLDIYIKDDDNGSLVWQVQFGYYTWATWFILNKLLTVRESLKANDVFRIVAQKGDDGFYTWFISVNGTQLKQKFTRSQDAKLLKFKPNGDPDNDKIKNKHIDTWFIKLCEMIKYDGNHADNVADTYEFDNVNDNLESNNDSFDDAPF